MLKRIRNVFHLDFLEDEETKSPIEEKDKIYVLLDIDGVLNPYGRLDKPYLLRHNEGLWQFTKENVRFLVYLALHPKVEVFWISSWGGTSNLINEKLKIKPFKVLHEKPTKALEISQFVKDNSENKIVVVDDEEFSEDAQLSIQPNYLKGLIEEERNIIKKYIEEN